MGRALVLGLGALCYLWFTQMGRDLATREVADLQTLYTRAGAQADAISAADNQASAVGGAPLAK